MSEMIETVAMAIYERHKVLGAPWGGLSGGGKRLWLDYARAALEAIRTPTDAMMDAGRTKTNWGPHGTDECWQAMIDAALTHTKEDR